jgi:hypothetical protein
VPGFAGGSHFEQGSETRGCDAGLVRSGPGEEHSYFRVCGRVVGERHSAAVGASSNSWYGTTSLVAAKGFSLKGSCTWLVVIVLLYVQMAR